MFSDRSPYRQLGNVTYRQWYAAITGVGGPAEFASRETWEAAKPHSALLLALAWAESKYGTFKGRNDPSVTLNPWSFRVPTYAYEQDVRGYLKFDGYPEAASHGIDRVITGEFWLHIDKPDPYKDDITIRDLISTFSPPQYNQTDRLITEVVNLLNGYEMEYDPEIHDPGEVIVPLTIKRATTWHGPNRPGVAFNNEPLWIGVHDTGNTNVGANAMMHKNFVLGGGGSSRVSFHFTVDDKGAWQMLPLDEIGWHAADGCDSREEDEGCYATAAIEMCVNRDADIWKTYANLKDLIAAIINGDPQIDYGKRSASDFSIDRIWTHQMMSAEAWGGTGKYCPAWILNNGLWPDDLIAGVRSRLGQTPPAPPKPDPQAEVIVPGLDYALAARLFGKVTGEDNREYGFDRNGPVSKKWLARGVATGSYPALESVWVYTDSPEARRRYFLFADGWTVAALGNEPIRELKQ